MLHLSKIALDNGGTIVPLIIPSEETNQTGLCNPSIYVDGDDILVNIRNVGYTLQHSIGAKYYKDEGGKFYTRWGPLSYIHPEKDAKLRTNNFFCEYDNKSNSITKHNLVDTTELDVEPNWTFIGLEDARIVRWDGKLYLTGVRRDVHSDGEGRMELSEIYITPRKVQEISRCRIEVPFESYCDKNWMPILDMPYHYVRWSNPLEIIKVDPERGTSEIVHKSDNFLDVSWNEGEQESFCGSSQVIPWDNGCRLAIIHECQWWRREERGIAYKDARYKHRILLWDSDWNLIKYTDPFTFMDGQVEFCCGVASVDDDLLITFGFQDNAAYLLKVNKDVINNLMEGDEYKKVGIDIGACIGETLYQFDDFDIVYAIEPAEEEFKILKEKYKNDKRIIPIQCAISDENGEDILNCYENGRYSSFLEFNKEGKFYEYCEKNAESFDILKRKIKVKTIRLDTFIEKYNLNKIDYLKTDTQGYDLKVVQSLGKYIKNIKKIRLEVQLQELYKGSSTKKEIIQYMNNNNFQLIDKVDGDGKEYEQDLIFENKLFSLKDKIDIVIQGQYDDYVDELIEHYKKLDFVNNIIVSCWEKDKESVSLNGVKFIRSKYPDDRGTANRNLQIVSSLAGLKQVTTKYAFKIRSDQKYSHKCMNDMYEYFIKNKESALKFELNKDKPKNSIITGGIFSPFPFHPRDHIFWGHKDDLIDLFNIPLDTPSSNEDSNYDVTTNIRTESYIGTHYCSNFDNRLKLFLKEPVKYLYDNCEKFNETLLISDKLTHKVFKSVPSNIIELEWPKYGWTKYRFNSQRERFGERWAEDFEKE